MLLSCARAAINAWSEAPAVHGGNRTILARRHVIPALGPRNLALLSAEEVDQWLATKAKTLSTDTLHRLLSILRQSIRPAQARDLVELRGLEPLTSSMPWKRATNCAKAP